ncbi:hypothetical protein [Acidovorax sp. BL-A-41-H1]|uniref:hypothetical protein n=1 Tax=Acidovorax sp. BL-A-41-H1 TaxID=3421102 RepID=UPI003F7B2460
MIYEDQFTLSLLTACVMQQNQLLTQQIAVQRDLMDRVDSVGDLLWRMDLRNGSTRSQVDQTGPGKRTAKKRHLARKKATSRKHGGQEGLI